MAKAADVSQSHEKGAAHKPKKIESQSGPTSSTPYDTRKNDKKGFWKEEVLEETPYEHHVRERHEADHLGSRFWDVDQGLPSLYHRLQEHYKHEHHDVEPHGHWEGVAFDIPVHEEVHYIGDREHAFKAPII